MSRLANNRLDAIREMCGTRIEFAQHLRALAPMHLSLHEVRAAVKMLQGFPEPADPLKIAVLGSYTTELLRDYWRFHGLVHGFDVNLYFAPYGQVTQELHNGPGLQKHQADFTYLLLRWSDVVPALADPLSAFDQQDRKKLIDRLESGLTELLSAAQKAPGTVVLSFLPSNYSPTLGLHDVMLESSESKLWLTLKQCVSDLLRNRFPFIYFDDGDHLMSTLGEEGLFDPRLWYSSRYPFSVEGANLFVQRLFRFPVLLRTPKVKCIALDCDNTLWGGIIGEDGIEGIELGPDYPGSCYVAFQRRLIDFLNRGFLLAICSKNNPGDVERVIKEQRHMVLRDEHFSAIRVNWELKPDNLRSIAEELNIGTDSFLFVDDSPQECRMMRQLAPEVRVAQVPERPLDIPKTLDHLQELELLSFTEEDRNRSRMYLQNRQRLELAVSSSDVSEYLRSLQMNMQLWVNGSEHIARLSQMTQKTNQFNLTTKRYSEKDILSFIEDQDWLVSYFSLSDVFGDNGIVGLALVSGMTTRDVSVDSLLMSCRVIGRKAEETFLFCLLNLLRDLGKRTVTGHFVPTQKNVLVQDFWEQQGFSVVARGVYSLSLEHLPERQSSLDYFAVQSVKEGL